MGILKEIFGDNRVLTAKNEEIQEVITYMYRTYGLCICEFTYRREKVYMLKGGNRKLFNYLYKNGMISSSGNIVVPGNGEFYDSKTEAYEGLVWLYNFLEERENIEKKDKEWF